MHGPVGIDHKGNLVTLDVQLYSDKRAADIAQNLRNNRSVAIMENITGNTPGPQWMGIKIKWIREFMPDTYERVYKFFSPKDFINFRLTSEIYIDPSEASGTYLIDQNTDDWSPSMTDFIGINMEKLPTIAPATQIIGSVTKYAAQETGLFEGTPVVTGGGDMLCALLGAGLIGKGYAVDLTGTGSVIGFYSDKAVVDSRLTNLRHVMKGWVPYYCIDSSGGAFRWLRDNLCKQETLVARERGLDPYDYLTELVTNTNYGADGVMFFPSLLGERTMGSAYSKGVFIGMTPSTTIAHMTRAVLEGIAFFHKRALDVFDNYTDIDTVIHIGGAAKGDVWSQIKSDIYGKPVVKMKNDESTVLGVAMLAGVGAGIYESQEEAVNQIVKIGKGYNPDNKKRERYDRQYEIYCEIHDALQNQFIKYAEIK